MQASPGPIIPRRRIAAELRRLRTAGGLTLEQVARDTLISSSKISRLENAQGVPQQRDIRDLIRHYGIEDNTQESDRIMRWVRAARRQGWWHDYPEDIRDPGFTTHIDYESEALVARVYTIPWVPVLLQTEDYARAFYQATEPARDAASIEQLVALRMRRGQALRDRESHPPLELVAVAHEACLHQRVGDDRTMREQLRALIAASESDTIELRILPFTAPPAFTSGCMYACFDFSDAVDVVAVETHAGFRHIEAVDQVATYRKHHDELRRRALDPARSIEMIKQTAERYH